MDRCSNSSERAVWEEKGAEEKQSQEKESVERRSMCAKRLKSRETLCFGNVLRPRRVRKVGSLKRRERSHLAGWEIKTPMWRETHFEVKMFKTLQLRTAFGSCAVGCGAKRFWNLTGWKSERGVGAKRILKSKSYNTSVSEHFWKLRRWKSARGVGEAPEAKMEKHTYSERFWKLSCWKTTPLWREAHLATCSSHFWMFQAWLFVARTMDFAPSEKWAKRVASAAIAKTMARVGFFEEDMPRCMCRVASAVEETLFIRHVRRSGSWFPEMGCILEHQIFRFPKMILRDRCSTSYDLASFFVAGAIL